MKFYRNVAYMFLSCFVLMYIFFLVVGIPDQAESVLKTSVNKSFVVFVYSLIVFCPIFGLISGFVGGVYIFKIRYSAETRTGKDIMMPAFTLGLLNKKLMNEQEKIWYKKGVFLAFMPFILIPLTMLIGFNFF